MKSRQLVAVEKFLRPRMVGILGAGVAPALPDFVARLLQHGLVGGVLPLHQILDDAEQPLPLLLLLLLGREQIRVRQRVVDHLRDDHRPRRRQRSPRPPQMQRGRMAVADRFLARAGDVDGFEWKGDFDELFLAVTKRTSSVTSQRRHSPRAGWNQGSGQKWLVRRASPARPAKPARYEFGPWASSSQKT